VPWEAALPAAEQRWFEEQGIAVPERVWQPGSCGACEGSGYHGRTGLFEVRRLDRADYEMLLAGADEQALRRRLHGMGMANYGRMRR